jgi:hypothetical protein
LHRGGGFFTFQVLFQLLGILRHSAFGDEVVTVEDSFSLSPASIMLVMALLRRS